MCSFSLSQSIQDRYFWIRIWLVGVLIASMFLPAFTQPAAAAPDADIFQTIEDFISLGANTVREIDKAIEQAGYEMRATLEQLRNEINSMIQTLSETYQDNLNITLESLDGFTRNRIMELQVQMEKINAEIQKDITLASQAAKDVIQEASRQIHRTAIDLEESLKNVLYFGGETVAYVVDRAVHNAILIISIILFGLGLLLFIFLLFTRRLPSGLAKPLLIGFMAVYLALFGSLALVPSLRGYAMAYTGIGLEARLNKVASVPRISDLVPDTIITGVTPELEIWGASLIYQEAEPQVWIDQYQLPVNASSPHTIVLNVSGLPAMEGSRTVKLVYPDQVNAQEVVHVIKPTPIPQKPDLVVTSFTVTPNPAVEKQNTRAQIIISNQGQGAAGPFRVKWLPVSSDSNTAQYRVVNGLGPGTFTTLNIDYAYLTANHYSTRAEVDPYFEVDETNEGNNSRAFNITVNPQPPQQARINISGNIHIVDDEGWFSDEIGDHPVSQSDIYTANQSREYHYQPCTGDEVRVELDLRVVVQADLTATVTGSAKLYEGTSCTTDDEEDSKSFSLTIPSNGQPVLWDYQLINAGTGGGDTGTIHLSFTNTH